MSSEKTGLESNPTGSEFFDALREMNSDWIARAAAEVELGLKLSKNLSSAHSVPDAITAYQEERGDECTRRRRTAVDVQWTKISWTPALDF